MLMPILDSLSTKHVEGFTIAKVNVDKNQELAGLLQIRSIPSLFFFKDGKIVDHLQGMHTEDAIRELVADIPDEKEARRKLKELESEAWEDFLDMTISQALNWASHNIMPEESPSEIAAEISGCSGPELPIQVVQP